MSEQKVMETKPEIGEIVYYNGKKAQVDHHWPDAPEMVRIILFPQAGVNANARYQRVNIAWLAKQQYIKIVDGRYEE